MPPPITSTSKTRAVEPVDIGVPRLGVLAHGLAQPAERATASDQRPYSRSRSPSPICGSVAPGQPPLLVDLAAPRPEAGGQPGEVRGAQRRRLGDLGNVHRHAEDVGLELHEEVVGGGAAVAAELLEPDRRVPLHRLDHVAGLVGHGLQGGAGDVGARRAAGEADDGAARVRVPVRRRRGPTRAGTK